MRHLILAARFIILALEDVRGEKRPRVLGRTFLHDLLITCGGVQGLAELLEDVVALHRHHEVAEGRSIRPAVSTSGTIETDPALLGRVIGNLVQNALEATRPGNRVVVRGERLAREIVISVQNPEVIPRDVQPQIFQRSLSTKGGEGRGVGTYSVRLSTERYLHGRVRFESTKRAGTSFEIVIPNEFPVAAA